MKLYIGHVYKSMELLRMPYYRTVYYTVQQITRYIIYVVEWPTQFAF